MGQEFPSDYGLQAYYSCDTLPEIPDNAAGTTYLQDAWATTDGWDANVSGPPTVSGGKLTTTSSQLGIYKLADGGLPDLQGKTVRIKVVSAAGGPHTIQYRIGTTFTTISTTTLAPGVNTIICVYIPSGSVVNGLRLGLSSIDYAWDWIYFGSGLYDTLLTDNSGNGNNMSVTAACPTPGISGNGLYLNGVTASASKTLTTPLKILTISCWASIVGFEDWACFPSTLEPYSDSYGFSMSFINSTTVRISYGRGVGLAYTSINITVSSYSLGTNYYWTSIFNETDSRFYIYRNGSLVGNSSVISTIELTSSSLGIGRWSILHNDYYINGTTDEIRFYSRALSADDIYNLYTNVTRPVYPAIAPSVESSSTQASIFVVNSTASGFALTSTIDNYENLLFERSMAGIGKFQFSMLADAPQAQYVQVNSYIIVSSAYGQPQARVGIILSVDRGISSDHKKVLNVTGFEAKGMFSWRLCVPLSGTAYFSGFTLPAETIFKVICNYQGGVSTEDASRKFYNLLSANSLGRGTSYYLSERYTNAAAVMERLALASKIGWAVSWTGSGLLFDVIVGKDRTLGNGVNTPAILSTDFDTVRESHLVSDQTSYKSLAYVGGQGAGTSRVIQTRYTGDGLPSGIARKEIFIDARDLNTTAKLDARGDEVLASVSYTSYITALVNPNSLFVKSSGAALGDYITVQSFGYQMTSQIVGITEQWGANGYEIEYALDKKPNTLTTVISNEAGKLNRLMTGMEA